MKERSSAEGLLFKTDASPVKWYYDSLQTLPKNSLWHEVLLSFSLPVPAGRSAWGLAVS